MRIPFVTRAVLRTHPAFMLQWHKARNKRGGRDRRSRRYQRRGSIIRMSKVRGSPARAQHEFEPARLDEIVSLMERHRIKRVPVTRDAHLVGIVSRANLMRAMISIARSAQPPAQSDLDIRSRIMTEMDTQKWAPVALIEVTVNKGVVDLWGTMLDERDRKGPEGACGERSGRQSRKRSYGLGRADVWLRVRCR